MYIIIVGGGKVGHFLAKKLAEDKHTVALIERDEKRCQEIADETKDIVVIRGNGCDTKILEEAGVSRADVLAAVTGKDEDNLVICQLAKEMFKVSRTVAMVNKPGNEHVFSILGVDVPINSTMIIAKIIEEEASFEDLVTLMTFRKGKLALVRVDLAEDSPACGKKVKDIKLPKNSILVAIIRGEDVAIPTAESVFQSRDDIVVLTSIENEQQVLDTFLGKIE